jgi:hypothetical protein
MPKLLCPCGYVHDLSPIPDAGWLVVRDVDYESLIDAEVMAACDASTAQQHGEPETTFVRVTGMLYACPKCERLMWRRPGEAEFRVFGVES